MQKIKRYPPLLALFLIITIACTPIRPAPTPAPGGTVPPPTLVPQSPAATANTDLYVDPEGLFQAPIPTGWMAQQASGYAVLLSPAEAIRLYVLTVQADNAEAQAG